MQLKLKRGIFLIFHVFAIWAVQQPASIIGGIRKGSGLRRFPNNYPFISVKYFNASEFWAVTLE